MSDCGYAYSDYRCKHPDCDDYDDNGERRCFARSCPLGSCAEKEDFVEFGEDPECMTEGDWLIVHKSSLGS